MFAAVTVLALTLAYHLNWIRDRHEFLAKHWEPGADWQHATPPGLLVLFGERGYSTMNLLTKGWKDIDDVENEIARAYYLFPELEGMGYWEPEEDAQLSDTAASASPTP